LDHKVFRRACLPRRIAAQAGVDTHTGFFPNRKQGLYLSNITSVFPISYVHEAVTGGQIRRKADLDGRKAAPKGCEPGTASIKLGATGIPWRRAVFGGLEKRTPDQVHGPGAVHFVGFDLPEERVATIGDRNPST